jgi:hypothetical protein
VSGRADDLLAWLWHRGGREGIELTGDDTTITELIGLLDSSIN